jgi:hypothetical protein
MLPVFSFGARKMTVTTREPQRSKRSRFLICTSGKASPKCARSFLRFKRALRWAKTREECANLIVYQSPHDAPADSVYHPTLIGPDFFHKTGGVL